MTKTIHFSGTREDFLAKADELRGILHVDGPVTGFVIEGATMTKTPPPTVSELKPCPFCGGPAKEPIHYNGTLETGCAGPHECPGTDVLVPLAAWNHRFLDTADGVEHPDDVAVDKFAAAMKAKLAKKRGEGRSGWENKDECSAAFLSSLLHGHVIKGDPVDVANLAMMLHQRGEPIMQTPNSAEFVPSGSSFAFSSRTEAGVAVGYARAVDVDRSDWPFKGKTSFWCNERQNAYYTVPLFASPPAQEAVTDALERAAAEAYRVCAETRHVTLGDKASAAILALIPLQLGKEG